MGSSIVHLWSLVTADREKMNMLWQDIIGFVIRGNEKYFDVFRPNGFFYRYLCSRSIGVQFIADRLSRTPTVTRHNQYYELRDGIISRRGICDSKRKNWVRTVLIESTWLHFGRVGICWNQSLFKAQNRAKRASQLSVKRVRGHATRPELASAGNSTRATAKRVVRPVVHNAALRNSTPFRNHISSIFGCI